jgi:hypothetical protein
MVAWGLLLAGTIAGAFLLLRPERARFRGSTLLGFLLLTVGMTSPLALHPKQMMLAAGSGTDAFIGVWDLWWTRCAAALGLNALDTRWLFYPNGTSLALHTNALTYGAASLPVQAVIAPGLLANPSGSPSSLFLIYNLILFASFTLTGYFTYRLALHETGHRAASILAGALFAFAHFRFANTVRLHVIATELLVLAVWAWVALLRRPAALRFVLWLGAMLLLVYGSLEYAAYAVVLFVALAVPVAIRARRAPRPRVKPTRRETLVLAGGFAGAVILALPLLTQLARRAGEGAAAFDPRLSRFFSADLLDFVLPNPRHPLWGGLTAPITANLHRGDGGFGLSLGWVAIALLVLAAIALFRARDGRRWFWGFAVCWLLTLGPALHVGGSVIGLPMPQAILAKIAPWLAASRTPIRYVAPAELCLALAIAVGLARRWSAAPPRVRALPAILLGLVLFESLAAPLPLIEVPVPGVYREINAAPGTSVLAQAPPVAAREALLYQTVHRQRLAENLENAIPLRSRRGPDLFAGPGWTLLTQKLGEPGWVASLAEGDRERLFRELRGFLRDESIRWVVVLRTRPELLPDGRLFRDKVLLDDASYDAFLDNLKRLDPLRSEDNGDNALFEFDTGELDPRH